MPFKINIATKDGKTWKIESESEALVGKKLGDSFDAKEISADLEGYQVEITGASDKAGFAHKADVEGPELKRVLLTKGWGMHKKPRKEGKKKVSTPGGLRLRKTVRGGQISDKTVQINVIVTKEGGKKLAEVFPDQNKAPEQPAKEEAPAAQAESDSKQADAAPEAKTEEKPETAQEEKKE